MGLFFLVLHVQGGGRGVGEGQASRGKQAHQLCSKTVKPGPPVTITLVPGWRAGLRKGKRQSQAGHCNASREKRLAGVSAGLSVVRAEGGRAAPVPPTRGA